MYKRQTLACVLIRPDGSTHKEENIPKDEKHPLYRDIVSQYSSWEIKTNTERQVHNQTAAQEAESDQKKEFENHKQREDLWNAKQDFLKLPCMKNPVCKEFKREVRKSQTVIGAQAFAVAAILKDFEDFFTLDAASINRSKPFWWVNLPAATKIKLFFSISHFFLRSYISTGSLNFKPL